MPSRSDDSADALDSVVFSGATAELQLRHELAPSIAATLADDGTLRLEPVGGGEAASIPPTWGRRFHAVFVTGRDVRDCIPTADREGFHAMVRQLAARHLLVPTSRLRAADVGRFDHQVAWFASEGVDGRDAQRRLAAATVLVLGLGGFGSAITELLARAGVGQLVLADPERIRMASLAGELLYGDTDVGTRRSYAAASHLERIAPGAVTFPVETGLASTGDVRRMFHRYRPSLVVFSTHGAHASAAGWVDEAAFADRVPVLHGGARAPHVTVGPLVVPGATPCHACCRGAAPESTPDTAAGAGWCDVTAAAFATAQVVGFLTGVHEPVVLGRSVTFDARTLATTWGALPRGAGAGCCERCER